MNTRSNSKRKSADISSFEPVKRKPKGSKELSAYFKTYKDGINDIHWPLFREVFNITSPKRVLYPGCHRHITASLIFQDIVYVDSYKKIEAVFSDEKVLEWVNENKEYNGDTKIKFLCQNFEKDFGEESSSFDLIMSLSAGIVTKSCSKYLNESAYFLVSDAHFDARTIYLDPDFTLTHVWDFSNKCFLDSKEDIYGHFTTTKGEKITKEMVQESIDNPKAKRSFKLIKEELFYLFKKTK